MVESQIKLSERVLLNNPNIKTKSELELKADLIKEIEEQIKSLDHTGNGFGILVSNITGFVSGYNFLLNDYKKLLEQAKTSQLTYKQLNDQYLALGNRLSGVAETSDTWALGSQVVKSTTETASVLAGKAIGGVAGGTAAGTLSSGLNSLAGNATSSSIGGDTFDPKKVGIETGQGFVKSAIIAVSFKVGEVSGAASASALVKALRANSISPKILNLVGGTVGGFSGGGFGNGAGQVNEMVMSKFGLGNKKEFDWDSFRLSLGFGGLGGAVGSQFGHSVPAIIADGLTGAGLGLGELAANNGGSLQGIPKEEFANTIAQSLVNPFIGKAVAHHNYSNPENLIKNPEAVSSLTKENTKELLKIANEHTLNNNPEKYIEFMTNFVKNATDEQLDSVSYNHFEEFFSKLKTNKLSENTINKTFELLGLCSLKESNFVSKVFENLAWEQLIEYNPDKAFRILNTIANKHESQERVLIYQFTNHLDNYRFVGYSVKDKLSPEVKAEIVLTLSSRDFRFHHYHYDDRTIKYITKTLFEYGVLKQNEDNKYFESLKEFIGKNYSSNSYYTERKNYLQEIIVKTPTEEIKNKEILDLFANDFIYSNDMNLHSKLVEIDPERVLKELYDQNFVGDYLQYTNKEKLRQIGVEIALKNPKEEYAQKIIDATILDHYLEWAKPDENNRFAKLIENCSGENLWNLVLDKLYHIDKTYLFRDELISKLENSIETLQTKNYSWTLCHLLLKFKDYPLTEENLKIKSLKEKLVREIIETENVDAETLFKLASFCPESRDLIVAKHFKSFDNNTFKSLIDKLLAETNENNFEQNKIFLQKIINHLGKEEVLNILVERRKNTAERIYNLQTVLTDKVIFELGLGNNEFFKLIKLELSKSIISYIHDNNWKQYVDNFFNILMSESKGIYLKDLFIDKYIDYRERDNTLKILENNIQSLDYLKPEYFDPEQLNSEQKQILFENLRNIYRSAKSKEFISKLQPLTKKLFMENDGSLFEEAKTDVLSVIKHPEYDIIVNALPELEIDVKNNLEKASLESPIGFIKSFYEVNKSGDISLNDDFRYILYDSNLSSFFQKLIIDRSYEILVNEQNEEILKIFNHVSEEFILKNLEDNTELTPENISKINTIFKFQQIKSQSSISKTIKSLLDRINIEKYENASNIKKLFNESPELIPVFINELNKFESEEYIINYKFIKKIDNTQLTNLYKENLLKKLDNSKISGSIFKTQDIDDTLLDIRDELVKDQNERIEIENKLFERLEMVSQELELFESRILMSTDDTYISKLANIESISDKVQTLMNNTFSAWLTNLEVFPRLTSVTVKNANIYKIFPEYEKIYSNYVQSNKSKISEFLTDKIAIEHKNHNSISDTEKELCFLTEVLVHVLSFDLEDTNNTTKNITDNWFKVISELANKSNNLPQTSLNYLSDKLIIDIQKLTANRTDIDLTEIINKLENLKAKPLPRVQNLSLKIREIEETDPEGKINRGIESNNFTHLPTTTQKVFSILKNTELLRQEININSELSKLIPEWGDKLKEEGVYQHATHYHNFDEHTRQVIEHTKESEIYKSLAEEDQENMLLAALLHDIGKATAQTKEAAFVDDGHGDKSLELAFQVADRLGLSPVRRDRIARLIEVKEYLTEGHHWNTTDPIELQKIAFRAGTENFLNMSIALGKADSLSVQDSSNWWNSHINQINNLKNKIMPYITSLENSHFPLLNWADHLSSLFKKYPSNTFQRDQYSKPITILELPHKANYQFLVHIPNLQKTTQNFHSIERSGIFSVSLWGKGLHRPYGGNTGAALIMRTNAENIMVAADSNIGSGTGKLLESYLHKNLFNESKVPTDIKLDSAREDTTTEIQKLINGQFTSIKEAFEAYNYYLTNKKIPDSVINKTKFLQTLFQIQSLIIDSNRVGFLLNKDHKLRPATNRNYEMKNNNELVIYKPEIEGILVTRTSPNQPLKEIISEETEDFARKFNLPIIVTEYYKK